MITNLQAILSLTPNAQFKTTNGVITEWLSTDITQPTDAEIEAEVARLQAEYDAAQYQRDRAKAYPSIGDQLDMIFHAGLGGDEFQAAIQAVKEANPKTE
jgi:hypothetical protein